MKRESPFPRNSAKRRKKQAERNLETTNPVPTSASVLPVSGPSPVVPVSSKCIPVSTSEVKKIKPWWAANYLKKDIVALDVEMVTLKRKNENGKHIQRAATVASG